MASPFPDDVVRQAFARSRGQCECKRTSHRHGSPRCPARLVWERRGYDGPGGWEAHHINANDPPTLSNCEILCQPCHKATETYG